MKITSYIKKLFSQKSHPHGPKKSIDKTIHGREVNDKSIELKEIMDREYLAEYENENLQIICIKFDRYHADGGFLLWHKIMLREMLEEVIKCSRLTVKVCKMYQNKYSSVPPNMKEAFDELSEYDSKELLFIIKQVSRLNDILVDHSEIITLIDTRDIHGVAKRARITEAKAKRVLYYKSQLENISDMIEMLPEDYDTSCSQNSSSQYQLFDWGKPKNHTFNGFGYPVYIYEDLFYSNKTPRQRAYFIYRDLSFRVLKFSDAHNIFRSVIEFYFNEDVSYLT
ncbi:MAG: hypothetical protein KAH18_07455 [Psychromonas sp.]|nr:hypothetical protein [Psychromonas sp.]